MEKTNVFFLLCGILTVTAWQSTAQSIETKEGEKQRILGSLFGHNKPSGNILGLGGTLEQILGPILGPGSILGQILNPPSQQPTPAPTGSTCPSYCPSETCEICASCNGKNETFENECKLQQHNCGCSSENKCTKIKDGACCNYNCQKIYDPVCACCDGKNRTFDNDCLFKIHKCENPGSQCTVIAKGNCVPPCFKNCTTKYEPVCAVCNGNQNVTYPNQCKLDEQNCLHPGSCNKIRTGECCNYTCPTVVDPVCACCDGKNRTFDNDCLFKIHKCENPDSNCTLVLDGVCDQPCPVICPFDFEPVCAVCNGSERTFPNDCTLRSYMCKHPGSCKKVCDKACQKPPKCWKPCLWEKRPVCASCNGHDVSFPNQCLLDDVNCVHPKACVAQYEGLCRPKCAVLCPAIYSPVCANCSGVLRNFSSACQLTIENCNHPNSCVELFDGVCPQPPICQKDKKCPKNFDPVCAICNGIKQVFGNECLFNNGNCRSNGGCTKVCRSMCEETCPEKCDGFGAEVCARKGKEERTFCNECWVKKKNCEEHDKKDWTIVKNGPCLQNPCIESCPEDKTSQVCAFKDGKCKPFPNECAFKKANCECEVKGGKKWLKLNDGPCQKDKCEEPCDQ